KVFACVVAGEGCARKDVDQPAEVLSVEVRTCVDAWQEATKLVGVCVFKRLQNIIEMRFDVVAPRCLNNCSPSRLWRHNKRTCGPILVRVVENRGTVCVDFRVIVARRIIKQDFELCAALFVPKREES